MEDGMEEEEDEPELYGLEEPQIARHFIDEQ